MRALAAILCALALPLAAAEPGAVALDGTAVPGPLMVDPVAGTAVGDGRTVRLGDLDRVTLPITLPPATGAGVWLADGGWIPGAVTADSRDDHLAVSGPWGAFVFPLAAVRSWGEAPEDAGREDVVVLAGGTIRGRIEGLRAGALAIRSTLRPDPVPLDRILGARLAGAVRPPKGVHLTIQPEPGRPPLAVALRDGRWRPAAASEGMFAKAGPGAGIAARIEGPRRTYLSDVTPTLVEDRGAFGVVWPWQRDRDLDGAPIRVGGRWHSRGITVHSEARLQWPLKGQFLRLRGQLGIADAVAPEGDCVAIIAGDGRELVRHRARGGAAPLGLDVGLAGVQTLELRIEMGERHDIGDHLVIADGTLVRAKP